MSGMLNKNSMSISHNPEFFVSGLIKPGRKTLGIADLSFFDQITGKYRHTGSFIKTQLYYLYFPKQIKFLKKNLSINFFIHSHFNIFPAIVKNISCLHRNFIENRQEDLFLTKISNLLKAPIGFNLSSQPVLHFQNIAKRAVKKQLKINYKSAKAQKHEIRPGNQVANIFFRDTSFFSYPRLNPISNRADHNIVEKKSKSMQNLVISEVTGPEKINIQISHPSCRPFLIHPHLQNPRNRITIPPVLLNVPVRGHIFARQNAADRQVRSDCINHISPASESNTDVLFFSDFLRDSQKRLKFYEKQSRQRSRRHGGMELAALPYTGVSSRIKSFAKPGSIKFSPAVLPFLQMEVSNKSNNIEHKMFAFSEKGLASHYMAKSRTHHITTIANLFTNKKHSNISKETIARPISLIPFERTAAVAADLRSLPATFSKLPVMPGNPLLEDSHPKKRARKQPVASDTIHFNIVKGINFDEKPINRMRYIPFSDSNFTYRFPDKANKDLRCVIGRQRTIAFPKSLSENLYTIKQRYMFRKSDSVKTINTTAQVSPLCPSERPHGAKNLFSRLKYSSKSRILRRFAPQNDNLRCSVNNPPHIEGRKNMREEIGRRGSISTQEPSMAGYMNNFPDMTYFSSNRSPHSTHMEGSTEVKKTTEFLKADSSYKTDHTKLLSVPEPDLYGLSDKVYGLIVERIKRERELRGR